MTIVKAAEQVVYDFSTHILTWRMTSSNAFKFSSSSFQLTSSQGGWQKIPYIIEIKSVFQLTSSQGGWHKGQIKFIVCANFQLTSSQGGWLVAVQVGTWCKFFNSHPHKEDDRAISCLFAIVKPFNSHPHKEDDFLTHHQLQHSCLSTHILTRRMTSSLPETGGVYVFQLTSSQGGWQQF